MNRGERGNPMYAAFERGELTLVATGFGVNFIVPTDSGAGAFRQRSYREEPAQPKCHDDLVGNPVMSAEELAEYTRTGVPPKPVHGGYPGEAKPKRPVFSIVGRD